MKNSKVSDCQMIDIRRYSDTRGYLSVVENGIDIPFDIKRQDVRQAHILSLHGAGGGARRACAQGVAATADCYIRFGRGHHG